MKRKIVAAAVWLVFFSLLSLPAQAAQLLIPVGELVGLQLQNDTLTVAAFDEELGSLAKEAGLKIGDELVNVNGSPVTCLEELRSALDSGETVQLTVRRSGKLCQISMTPEKTAEGPRMGVYLRQGIAGIGTITFYDPESGSFGALGHGVSNPKGGLLTMSQGSIFDAKILSVKKGKCGNPGQLKGGIDTPESCGSLLKNTPQGVFGVTKQGWKGEPVPVADYEDIRLGDATIRCTVTDGAVQEYSVELLKIYPEDRSDGRNFLLRVTDPALLKTTGGIVQGMSGSPILQDGRLIGAVTHVLVNDPAMGYGIFIESMLDAAA